MAENVSVDPFGRYAHEMSWVAIQPFLESRGYQLRPRFHPDWEPSWLQKGLTRDEAFRIRLEDSLVILVARLCIASLPITYSLLSVCCRPR